MLLSRGLQAIMRQQRFWTQTILGGRWCLGQVATLPSSVWLVPMLSQLIMHCLESSVSSPRTLDQYFGDLCISSTQLISRSALGSCVACIHALRLFPDLGLLSSFYYGKTPEPFKINNLPAQDQARQTITWTTATYKYLNR